MDVILKILLQETHKRRSEVKMSKTQTNVHEHGYTLKARELGQYMIHIVVSILGMWTLGGMSQY